MDKTKTKPRNRFMAIFLALLMFLSVLPTGIGLQKVEAATTVNVSHDTKGYKARNSYSGASGMEHNPENLFSAYYIGNFSSALQAELTGLFSGHNLITESGWHKEATYRYVEGFGAAICAQPFYNDALYYSDRINISASQLNDDDYNQFISTYANYRYPNSGSGVYGVSRGVLERGARLSFTAGMMYSGMTEEIYDKIVARVKENQNYDVTLPYETTQSFEWVTFWSWTFSPDSFLAEKHNAGLSFAYSMAGGATGYNDFYKLTAEMDKMFKSGELIVKNAQANIFYSPQSGYENTKGRDSTVQILHNFKGKLEIQADGSIQLKKVSSMPEYTNGNSNFSLAGAEYGVYSDKALTKKVGTLTTKVDGSSNVLKGLKTGTYFVKETKASKGFQLDPETYQVIVKANKTTTVKSIEVPSNGFIEIKKAVENPIDKTNAFKAGIVFDIYSDANLTTKVGSMTTNNVGVAKSGPLKPGQYWAQESSSQTLNVIPTKEIFKFTVTPNKTSTHDVVVKNTAPQATFVIQKADVYGNDYNENNESVFTNSKFQLEIVSVDSVFKNEIQFSGKYVSDRLGRPIVYSPNKNAEVIFTNLPAGVYRVRETDSGILGAKTNPGYIQFEVKLSDNTTGTKSAMIDTEAIQNTTIEEVDKLVKAYYAKYNKTPKNIGVLDNNVFYNYVPEGFVEVLKLDETTKEPMKGVEFTLESNPKGTFTDTQVTGEDGKVLFGPLVPYKDYTVFESKTPEGYEPSTFKNDFTAEPGKTSPMKYTVINTHSTVDFQVRKADVEGMEVDLTEFDGVVFHVKSISLVKNKYLSTPDSFETDVTVKDGYATITEAPLGVYEITEKSIPENVAKKYNLSGAKIVINANDVENVHVESNNTIDSALDALQVNLDKLGADITAETGLDAAESVFANQPLYGGIKIKKVWDENDQPLQGAIFNVSGGPNNYFNKDFTTDANGMIIIPGLRVGDYVVEEVKPAPGFVFSDKISETVPVVALESMDEITPTHYSYTKFENIMVPVDSDKSFKANILGDYKGEAIIEGAEYELRQFSVAYPGLEGMPQPGDVIETYIADANGSLGVIHFPQSGVYHLVEVSNPTGYLLNPEPIEIKLDTNETFTDAAPLKFDALKNVSILQKELQELRVRLTEVWNNLLPAEEQRTYTDEEMGLVEISEEDFMLAELVKLGRVEITKILDSSTELPLEKEDKTPEPGVVFGVYAQDAKGNRTGEAITKLTTNKDGKAASKYLPYGKYVLHQETTFDEDINKAKDIPFEIKNHRDVAQFTITNELAQMRLRIVKKDIDTQKIILQEGVKFEVYAAEQIVNPLTKVVKYEKDEKVVFRVGTQLIDHVTTNSEGYTDTFAQLLAGKYYLKEIEGPKGYFVSGDEKFEVTIPNESELENGIVNTIEITLIPGTPEEIVEKDVDNKPQYGELVINKIAEQLTGWKLEQRTVKQQLEEGEPDKETKKVPQANVAMVLESTTLQDVEKQVEERQMVDKTVYEWTHSSTAEADVKTTELTEKEFSANKELKAAVDKAIAKGQDISKGVEIITETTLEDGTLVTVRDFVIAKIIKVDSGVPSYKTVTVKEEVIKREGVRSDANGKFSREVSAGKYRLLDINDVELVKVKVAEGETGLVEFQLPHKEEVVEKYIPGEIVNKTYDVNVPVYELLPLAGAKFSVVADEDIKSYDGQTEFYKKGEKLLFASEDIKDAKGNVVYKKGDVISAPVLDESLLEGKTQDYILTGKAKDTIAARIPLGKYKVIEIEAPLGFKKDATENDIEFDPQVQTIEIVKKAPIQVENERQTIEVQAVKTLMERKFPEGQTPEVIVLGLYTKAPINGLAADKLVGVANPDKDGNVLFADVPAGNLYIKEISTINGYELTTEEFEVITNHVKDSDEDVVTVHEKEIENKPSDYTAVVVKVDNVSGERLPGVTFKLWKIYSDGSRELVKNDDSDVWVTDENGEIHVPGLDEGNYEWEEIDPSEGYINEGKVVQISVNEDSNYEITVGNNPTEMAFIKIDAETGKPVLGAKLALLNEDGSPVYVNDKGYVVTGPDASKYAEAVWTSGETSYVVRGLAVGKSYQLKELETPEGYASVEPLVFTVSNVVGIQLSSLGNKYTDIRIIKRDWSNGEAVEGATLEIRELNADGSLGAIAVDKVTGKEARWTTGPGLEDGFIIRGLKVGQEYEIVETKVPAGYLKPSEDIIKTFIVSDTEDIQTVVVVNEPIPTVGTIASYVDGTKENLPDNEITIVDVVKLDGLVSGQTYKVKGKMVNAENPSEVLAENSVTFVAESTSMTVNVSFLLDTSKLEGKTLVAFEQLFRYGRDTEDGPIAVHEDPEDKEQSVYVPKIGTTATDEVDGAHDALATESVTIVDEVKYTNLEPGKEHKVIGKLMSKETGSALLINGEEVISEQVFVSSESGNGSVFIKFTIDASELAGQTLVVFEEVYNGIGVNAKLIAEHKDITDEEQSVYIPEIGTSAANKEDETKEVSPERPVTIVDTVSYKNLLVGETYTVKGILMDKETGEALLVDGETVTASKEFVAESADGTVELEFTFDPSGLDGKTLVVFEEIYNVNAKLVAEHKDITDEEQTVYVPKIETEADLGGADVDDDNVIITITDVVKYEKLIPGKEYVLEGFLMDKETNEPILVDGEKVTSSLTFTPEKSEGLVEMTFELPLEAVVGKTIVVFEGLYRENKEVVMHYDIEDEAQTVDIPEVGTEADLVGADVEDANKTLTITDVVSYKNLVVGREYTVSGVLMDKKTGEALLVNGKEVTSEVTFTAESKEGTIELEFTLPMELVVGKTIVVFEDLLHEGKLVAFHRDIEDKAQTVEIPEIGTEANFDDGKKEANPVEKITIIDKVEYSNLVVGREYTVEGILMDKETGKALLVDGKEVTSSLTFVAEKADGYVELVFELPGKEVAGKTIVVFESLLHEGKLVATHHDINDEKQTVTVSNPEIGTTAKFEDGKEEATESEKMTIVDIVEYKDLVVGKTYIVKGILMDKSTGKPLLINGKEVVAETEFTAKTADGKVEVVFNFDGTGLGGKELVVFEKIYEVSTDEKGNRVEKFVTSHEDINDKGQTVKINKKPVPSEKIKTSDESNGIAQSLLPIGLIGAAGLALVLLAIKKRKEEKDVA